MARVLVCDICRKPTSRIVFKMYLSPKNGRTNGDHGTYTGYAEVGECCGAKEAERIKWRKRQTRPKKQRAS